MRTSRRALTFALVTLGIVGCATTDHPVISSAEPPFEWDSESSTPGTSLTLKEKDRATSPNGTLLRYEVRASGFSAADAPALWWKRGTSYSKLPATVDEDGTVRIAGSDLLMVGGYVPGQAVDLALAASNKRAQAKTIPFPIEAKKGDHSASVEIATATGLVFLITFRGFQPGEKVEIASEFEGERAVKPTDASTKGEVVLPVLFGPGDRGTATATATGSSGAVSIQYNVGADALVRQ